MSPRAPNGQGDAGDEDGADEERRRAARAESRALARESALVDSQLSAARTETNRLREVLAQRLREVELARNRLNDRRRRSQGDGSNNGENDRQA